MILEKKETDEVSPQSVVVYGLETVSRPKLRDRKQGGSSYCPIKSGVTKAAQVHRTEQRTGQGDRDSPGASQRVHPELLLSIYHVHV